MTRSGIITVLARSLCCSLAAVAIGLATGCQNRLSVRVERVLTDGSTRLDPSSRLGRQLDAAIVDLRAITSWGDKFSKAKDSHLNKIGGAELREVHVENLAGVTQTFADISGNAATLRVECEKHFDVTDVTRSTSELRSTLRNVSKFLFEARASASNSVNALKQTNTFKTLGAEGEELTNAVNGMQIAIEAAEKPSPGFGGFVSTDIYPINPSDPKYRVILNSSSPWAPLKWLFWKRNLSVELLTKAEVEVSGDSSIMLVMEHPGQYRIYQISNDPTQIARNIALVVSKATAAMARFAAIVP